MASSGDSAGREGKVSRAWIKLTKAGSEGVKIFCFPYSGGSAQVFLPFTENLPNGMGLHAFEMPGRGRRFRDDLLETMPAMVKEAVDGVIPLMQNSVSLFLGHSIGGIIAFETARELRRRHLPLPLHLFVSGARAPQLPQREETLYDLPFDDFVHKLKTLGGTPDEILENREMLEIIVPILKKDFQVFETHTYEREPPLDCPITAFGGSGDKFFKAADFEAWADQTSVLFAKHMLDGGHFIIHSHAADILNIMIQTVTLHRQW